MDPLTIRHVSVWLDELAPHAGAFAQALDWAARLGVPLQAVIPPARRDNATMARVEACAAACAGRGTVWEGAAEAGTDHVGRPLAMCAFGTTLPTHWRETWLHQSRRHDPTALLFCPDNARPIDRPLVLCRPADGGDVYLSLTARLCVALGVTPLVLVLAASEREAADRQQQVGAIFAAQRGTADYDAVIGGDPWTAAGCVARWRDCSHVFVEREPATASWRRWFRGELLDQLHRLTGARPILAVPHVPASAARDAEAASDLVPAAGPSSNSPTRPGVEA